MAQLEVGEHDVQSYYVDLDNSQHSRQLTGCSSPWAVHSRTVFVGANGVGLSVDGAVPVGTVACGVETTAGGVAVTDVSDKCDSSGQPTNRRWTMCFV